MNTNLIERQFERIGARAIVHRNPRLARRSDVQIDIGHDRDGEFFDIEGNKSGLASLRVLDTQKSLRHLLLMSEDDAGKHKFLCGHDERHWFVAAVPERGSVSNVSTAFDALKPAAVHALENNLKVKPRKRNRRRNDAFVRQGEWFFVPVPREFSKFEILRNEPISRGGGKPHLCEELVRTGGELVYTSAQFPNGLTAAQYRKRLARNPELKRLHWVSQRMNMTVFVRGKIRHADHKTIILTSWHQVLMNTENQSLAMRNVRFID